MAVRLIARVNLPPLVSPTLAMQWAEAAGYVFGKRAAYKTEKHAFYFEVHEPHPRADEAVAERHALIVDTIDRERMQMVRDLRSFANSVKAANEPKAITMEGLFLIQRAASAIETMVTAKRPDLISKEAADHG